jgi:hypothetical protein
MPLLIVAGIIVILVVVAVLMFGAGGFRAMRQRQVALRHDAVTDRVPSLRYVVPVGQDPAAVMAALMNEGFEVVRDDAATHSQDLLILCPAGVERERARVRAVIAHEAGVDMEGNPMPDHAIVFADEPRTT